jgi:polar amino acid transport system substrate-binding protein
MTAGKREATRNARRTVSSAIATWLLAALSVVIAAEVSAQEVDDLPPRDVYHERGRSTGDKIAFCVNPASMMAPFEMALAREIAARLLVTPNVIEVKTWHPTEPLDYRLPLAYDELYIEFAERCDGFMGMTLAPGYPAWLIITRPYVTTRTVLAATSADYLKLADVPANRALGTRMLGIVDNQLILYLQSLPEKTRWRRIPYFNNKLLLDRLLDRTVAAAFVWEPALYRATNGAPEAAGIHVIPAPFELQPTELGVGVRSNDSFLSVTLGQAIDSLRDDGSIDRLMVENLLAAKPGAGPSAKK